MRTPHQRDQLIAYALLAVLLVAGAAFAIVLVYAIQDDIEHEHELLTREPR